MLIIIGTLQNADTPIIRDMPQIADMLKTANIQTIIDMPQIIDMLKTANLQIIIVNMIEIGVMTGKKTTETTKVTGNINS